MNGFTLATEPFERWLQGCGCKELQEYYYASSGTKRKILDRLYHEYKRLNLSNTRIIFLFSIMEQIPFSEEVDVKKILEKRKSDIDPIDNESLDITILG